MELTKRMYFLPFLLLRSQSSSSFKVLILTSFWYHDSICIAIIEKCKSTKIPKKMMIIVYVGAMVLGIIVFNLGVIIGYFAL